MNDFTISTVSGAKAAVAGEIVSIKKKPLFFSIHLCCFFVFLFAMCWGSFSYIPPVCAAPVDIADVPLDVQLQASAPNIMFGIDDSGSMDWEILTNESDGLFAIGNTEYEYVFDNPGDNLYTSGVYSHVITGDNRRYWKSQWSEYNKMYYDPKAAYKPWHSAMSDADPNMVRSHPMYAENYTNLNATYYSLSAGSPIVKDDRHSTGISKSGNWQLYYNGAAYGGNDSYTTVDGSSFTWIPTIPWTEAYEVWVFNAYYSGNDQNAEYTIVHADGTDTAYSDQRAKGGEWDLLGIYTFNAGTAGSVTVTRKNHAAKGSYTNADAVKFVKVAGGVNIINAHYYVFSQSAGKPYLVNLDGEITYYRYNDDGDNYIEPEELVLEVSPPADIVTGRSYEQERQNFANWYSFSRKRWGVAVGAICQSLEMLEGVNVGIRSLNGYIIKRVHPIKVGGVDETHALLDILTSFRHDKNPIGATPLRNGLKKIGEYYSTSEVITPLEPELSVSPIDPGAGGGCQQNFAIMFTDGAYNGLAPGLGNVDGTFPPPYGDKNSGSLADVAMYYWMTDLDGDPDNNFVPTNFYDSATWQHMVTYTVAFGVNGTLDPDDYDLYNIDTSKRKYPTWPSPINDDYKRIDDLWHAAVNGRGKYLNAQDPQELVKAFLSVINDVIARIGSAAKVSINAEELNEGTVIYQSSYSTEFWSGDVKAYNIDAVTGEIRRGEGEELWSASEKLASTDWDTGRRIVTYNGTSGIPFRFTSLGTTQKEMLALDPAISEKMLNYLRGDRSLEGIDFRSRETVLGDFVHSAPLYDTGVLFVGSNDGMLHAFDANKTTGGGELFAYVPGLVFPNLSLLADPGYSHNYYVDLTPSVRNVNGINLLVGGLGKGGKGYFCIDVTDPFTITTEAALAARVKWEFPKSTTDSSDVADMGYSFSQPVIVNTKAGWVILFGNGYNSPNESALLFVLATDGSVLAKIDTGSGPSNGLSTPAVVDMNNDMLADYVYAGDLLGNLWKFDIQSANPADWQVAHTSGGDPAPLFTAKGPGGSIQPITTKPDVMFHCTRHGYIVVFGTGKYLGNSDFDDVSTQTLYGIWDYGDDTDSSEFLGTFNRAATPNLSNQPYTVSLLEQIELAWSSFGGRFMRITSDYESIWATEEEAIANGELSNPSSLVVNHAGWYFDLPLTKERIIRNPMIRDGMVIVITTIPKSTPCTSGGESILMEIQGCSGARPNSSQLDINEDGMIDEQDQVLWEEENLPPSGIHFPTLLYEPTILKAGDQELKLMSTAAGGIVTQRERAEKQGMFYWREIH
jgi:type IV pilus assembly protein PilY1